MRSTRDNSLHGGNKKLFVSFQISLIVQHKTDVKVDIKSDTDRLIVTCVVASLSFRVPWCISARLSLSQFIQHLDDEEWEFSITLRIITALCIPNIVSMFTVYHYTICFHA